MNERFATELPKKWMINYLNEPRVFGSECVVYPLIYRTVWPKDTTFH